MTYSQYRTHIDHELDMLNWVIDDKIASGLPYKQEARRHKKLIHRARKLRRPSLFARVASFVTLL